MFTYLIIQWPYEDCTLTIPTLFTGKLRHREAKQHASATLVCSSTAVVQPKHSFGSHIPHSQLCCKVSASPGPNPSVKLPWEASLNLPGQLGLPPLCSLVGPHAYLCPRVSPVAFQLGWLCLPCQPGSRNVSWCLRGSVCVVDPSVSSCSFKVNMLTPRESFRLHGWTQY